MFEARVLADSVAPNGIRLTTMLLTYPRFIHAEFMTHRVFSRNAASSRAIPVKKKLLRINDHPVEPVEWGTNKPGMQAGEACTPEVEVLAKELWHEARVAAMHCAAGLDSLSIHKQVANRILEPWDWMTTQVSSTSWRNFDILRRHPAADPNIRLLAHMRKTAYDESIPKYLEIGEWHLPWITDPERVEFELETLKQLSAGRSARLSYLTHDQRREPEKDIELFARLTSRDDPMEPGHWTPVEHQATPIGGFVIRENDGISGPCAWCHLIQLESNTKHVIFESPFAHVCMKCAKGHITSGNFTGWHQWRQDFKNQDFDA